MSSKKREKLHICLLNGKGRRQMFEVFQKARNKWESFIFVLVLQSHHYIGVFRTASLTKRDTEKEGQMSEK